MTVTALIVAAGRGLRVGGELPKQYLPLLGEPLLRHTARHFLSMPAVDHIRFVINPDDRDLYDQAVLGLDLLEPVAGGAERQDSVLNGLESLIDQGTSKILIHDCARPFPPEDAINQCLKILDEAQAAIVAMPVADTLKRDQSGICGETVERAGLWRAQTPQAFRFQAILNAHREAKGLKLTDDAAVAERAGIKVHLVTGSEDNFKVTNPEDLARAERLLMSKLMDVRCAGGFDVHKFGPGSFVTLCGIEIPHSHGLVGHSDADVGLHALTDALLGTIGAGDIGQHFPPTDEKWRGANSDQFLAHAGHLVRQKGGMIAHVDITLICERPKVGPHRPKMVERVAQILAISPDRVSIKATTTEELGFTGRREGIAAQAQATVRLPL